jgi:sugar lactone lactonase YvrE
MLHGDIEVFRHARAAIAESLWFEPVVGLHWSDLETGIVSISLPADPDDGANDDVLLLSPPIPSFQPTSTGGFVGAAEDTVWLSESDGSDWRTLATLEPRHEGIRLNEGKCDPFGRYVVGSMDYLSDDPDGRIYSVTGDGRVRTIVDSIGVANGFEWSDGGSRMYFSDTSKRTVYVGDYAPDGELRNIEPFLTGWQVDGFTRDADGGFWAGIYDTGHLVRFASDGTVDLDIDLPVGHATAVIFGGADFSTLFIATAREKLTESQLEEQPLTGSILAISTGTHGFPAHVFDLDKRD